MGLANNKIILSVRPHIDLKKTTQSHFFFVLNVINKIA